MTDMLLSGSQWLEQQRVAHCSTTVDYRHDGDEYEVSATFGRTEADADDGSGLTIKAQVQDFIIAADELGFEPVPGDIVVTASRKYEVRPWGGAECWRWSDPYRQAYRIHTLDIGADA